MPPVAMTGGIFLVPVGDYQSSRLSGSGSP